MRKILIVVVFLALSGVAAKAQTPRIELFTGFSYGQFNPGGLLAGSSNGTGRHFSSPGLEATGQFNFSRYFGVIADVSAYGATSEVEFVPVHLRRYDYLVGPQITARDIGPFSVFVRGLVGTSHSKIFVNNAGGGPCPNGQTTPSCSDKETRLAYGFGGGIDLNASKHIGLRLVQIDFLRTAFTNCNAFNIVTGTPPPCSTILAGRQDSYRIAAGFNWRF